MSSHGPASYQSEKPPGSSPDATRATDRDRSDPTRPRRSDIHRRASRSAAIFALAGQVPAPVLADLVGISTGKAAAWAKLAARDWSDYVANRAARR
jgi:hypothetical protein